MTPATPASTTAQAFESSWKVRGWVVWSAIFSGLVFLLYAPVLKQLVEQWWTDPDYGHGVFIPLFAGSVLWRERDRWIKSQIEPRNFGLLVIVGAVALLLLGSLGAELFLSRFSLAGAVHGSDSLCGGVGECFAPFPSRWAIWFARDLGRNHGNRLPRRLPGSRCELNANNLAFQEATAGCGASWCPVLPMAYAPISPVQRLLHPSRSDVESTNIRYELWRVGWQAFKEHPLRGVGLGKYPMLPQNSGNPDLKGLHFAHNTYLEIAAEMGIPRSLAFVAMIYTSFFALGRVHRRTIHAGSMLIKQASLAMQAGLLGCAVAILFSSLGYLKPFWLLIFLTMCTETLASKSMAG